MQQKITYYIAGVFMGLAIIAGAVAANVPSDFGYLWEVKAAVAAFTGLAGLCMRPPGSNSTTS